MPDSVLPTLCDHCIAPSGAFGRQARGSFSTLSFNDGKFHLFSPQWPIRAQSMFDRAAVRDEAKAHQLLAGSCFSSALARENSVAGYNWRLLRRLMLLAPSN
jgi:hypothetical protein